MINIVEENFARYQNQAILLGLKDWNVSSVSQLLENAVAELKSLPTAGKKKAYPKRQKFDVYYYNELITDTLAQIRLGRTAYIFSLEQVAEVILFERGSKFRYNPRFDCIEVSMGGDD